MKTWLLIALTGLSTPTWAQSTLALPDDFNPETTEQTSTDNGEQMKPLDSNTLAITSPEPEKSRVSVTIPPRDSGAGQPLDLGQFSQRQSWEDPSDLSHLTPQERAAHNQWFGNGHSQDRQPAPRPRAPVRDLVTESWMRVLNSCTSQVGSSRIRLMQCPSYASPSLRATLEQPGYRSALAEFDEVRNQRIQNFRRLSIHRIYGTFKPALARATGLEAAACWTEQGIGTTCVIGERLDVLRWIQGN